VAISEVFDNALPVLLLLLTSRVGLINGTFNNVKHITSTLLSLKIIQTVFS